MPAISPHATKRVKEDLPHLSSVTLSETIRDAALLLRQRGHVGLAEEVLRNQLEDLIARRLVAESVPADADATAVAQEAAR